MPKRRTAEAIWIESRNRWQINVQQDGKRKTFTSSTPGRKGKHEAEAKADDWLEAGQPDDMRFDAAWAQYLEHVTATGSTSARRVATSLGRVWYLPHLSSIRLSNLRLQDLQSIINDAAQAGRYYGTCKMLHSVMSTFLRFCSDRCYPVDPSIMRKVIIPSDVPRKIKSAVQPDQLQIIFSDSTELYHRISRPCPYIHAIRFLVVTGLRSGEMCGLQWDDITDDCVLVRRSINKYKEIRSGKTINAIRTLPLTSYARRILADQRAMLASAGVSSPYIFPRLNGDPLDPCYFLTIWHRYAQHHGITQTVHELRHTFISLTLHGMPVAMLQRIVGHSASMDTTGVYGHAMDGDLKISAQIMDDLFAQYIGSDL